MPREPIEILDTTDFRTYRSAPALPERSATGELDARITSGAPDMRAAIAAPEPDATTVVPRTVGVLTYNILAGGGARLDLIEAVIRDSGADVIGLQEVHRPELLATLAQRLGMHHTIVLAAGGWNVGVLSRWPVLETRAPTDSGVDRGLLEVLLELPDSQRLRLFVTHLSAGFRQRRAGEDRRLREIACVLERMRAARAPEEAQVLVGDFNSLAPGERLHAMNVLRHALAVDTARQADSHALPGHPNVDFILPPVARPFRRLLTLASRVAPLAWLCDRVAGIYMPRQVVRQARAAGFTDCYAARHPHPRTRALTCPAQAPAGRIDYIFASPALAERLLDCEVLTDTPSRPVDHASDHRPVLARFELKQP
jgi:endonuclease/exonuclease/phosphatase family metal-dependent hydrolase